MRYNLLKLFGLNKSSTQLDNSEIAILKSLGISEQLAMEMKYRTGNLIEGLYESQELDEYIEEPKLRGIKSVLSEKLDVPSRYHLVKQLQSDSRYKDYHIFCCGEYASDQKTFLGAIKTADQFECLQIFETNGINYNLTTEDVIKFFQKWHNYVNFLIVEVHFDSVLIQLEHLNFDMDEFARESIEFCPDFLAVVEDEQQMKQYVIERNGEVDFWWD